MSLNEIVIASSELPRSAGLSECGLDEAGRGALAGPIVVAAVVLPQAELWEDLAPGITFRDSKALTPRQRLIAYKAIIEISPCVIYVAVSPALINEFGINWANTEAFRHLIQHVEADCYIVDGRWKLPDLGSKKELTICRVGGDREIPSVMAAGIVAKVVRDRIMQQLHHDYPIYAWDHNTGHGTRSHIEAIRDFGRCEHHRTQFVNTALETFFSKA